MTDVRGPPKRDPGLVSGGPQLGRPTHPLERRLESPLLLEAADLTGVDGEARASAIAWLEGICSSFRVK